MRHIRRILLAIKNPAAIPLPAVAKAAQLAQAFGAELTLFQAIPAAICLGKSIAEVSHAMSDLDNGARSAHERSLASIAQRLRRRGIGVSISVQSDHPASEAILREAARIRADLVVAEAHAGTHHGAGLLRLTDWELLRRSPVPLLLVKGSGSYRRPKVLVALDPDHTFDKPVRLDAEVLTVGSTVSDALRGTLHAVHAYAWVPLNAVSAGTVTPRAIADVKQATAAVAAKKLAHAVRAADIPEACQHVVGRHVPDAIVQVATQCRSAIVVMGEVARSGLRRLLIGNTAERVLDQLDCDILLVKPPQGLRTRGERQRRSPPADWIHQ